MFFDDYPRFLDTSDTGAFRGRLNLRYEAIFAENREIFAGARVLDMASHDGRWSLAALACGAASVVGIEARAELVEHAAKTLGEYGYGADRATFIAGDVADVLNTRDFQFDVVMCLGYLYHTLRYNELMHGVRRSNPRHLIIDTVARPMSGPRAAVWLVRENVEREGNAYRDKYTYANSVIVGQPNRRAIRKLMLAYGYEVDQLSDWKSIMRDNSEFSGPAMADYAEGKRITMRCVDQAGGVR